MSETIYSLHYILKYFISNLNQISCLMHHRHQKLEFGAITVIDLMMH